VLLRHWNPHEYWALALREIPQSREQLPKIRGFGKSACGDDADSASQPARVHFSTLLAARQQAGGYMELSILPEALRKQAVILSGEAAWPKESTRDVIDFLLQKGYAVVGIELWIPEDNTPRVLGWSDYNMVFSGNWDQYVQLNAQYEFGQS
jgi:hypothetical protein